LSIETEVKVVLVDVAEFHRRLSLLKAVNLSERHFEDNYVLDYSDGRIRSQQGLLRVRLTGQACFLTYKGPPRPEGVFKSREELETQVEDGRSLLRILDQLGLQVWFRYQKFRQEFALAPDRISGAEVHIAVDVTPIGDFAEFEGSEEGIREVAEAMGFNESHFLRDSYYSLYNRFCLDRGKPVTNMVFTPTPPGRTDGSGEVSG
jgi:adenylate cyclase, class 2